MAHELTIRTNGRAEMAFVGETPWHGLGQSVTKGASIGVWQKEAGMDWEALEATPSVLRAPSLKTIYFGDHKALFRSDNHEPLAIVGQGYQVVQPKEVLEFFRDLTETGGWHIHTAGTLRGGRKLWAMASHGDVGLVGKGDEVRSNLLLATSLDGSMKTTAMLTSVRVVCANTLAMALRGAETGDKAIRVSHRSIFDPQVIKQALGVAVDSFESFMEQARQLADTPMDLGQARDLLNVIFKPTPTKAVDLSWMGNLAELKSGADLEESKDARSVGRILELFDGAGMGADLKTAKGTSWGLLNAVTQYVDHEMGRTPDTRLDAAWFGRGNQFKQQAFQLVMEAAEA